MCLAMTEQYDIYQGKLQAWSGVSLGERTHVLYVAQLKGQAYASPLEPRRFHHKPQMLDMDRQHLVFALLCFVFVWSNLSWLCLPSSLLQWEYQLCQFLLEVCNLFYCLFFLNIAGS